MELLNKYGYSVVFAALLLEQLGFPIPSAPVVILAGAFAAGGMLYSPLVLAAAVLACLVGDIVWYEIGRKKGRSVLKTLCRVSLSPDSCVRKTEDSFLKYGMNSLLFSKFLPGLNTVAPPMAGMFGASLLSFLCYDFAGSLIYCVALFLPGFLFEKAVFDITSALEEIGHSVLWIIIAAVTAIAAVKWIRLKLLQRVLYKERITPEELYDRITAGESLILLDLRSGINGDETGRLPGSIHILPGDIDQHLHRLDKERWIVMYCT
jgi:membrane protein DedA with SNARE-associated domain